MGKTVFLTTHYMDEAQQLADRVAIIVRGKIVAQGPPDQLANIEAVTTIRFRADANQHSLPDGITVTSERDDGLVTVVTGTPTKTLFELTRWATDREIELHDLTVARPSLEDAYLSLVGADDTGEDSE